jgi:hypothetical protein
MPTQAVPENIRTDIDNSGRLFWRGPYLQLYERLKQIFLISIWAAYSILRLFFSHDLHCALVEEIAKTRRDSSQRYTTFLLDIHA